MEALAHWPKLSLNGSVRSTLTDARTDAAQALRDAFNAVAQAAPHPRDYVGRGQDFHNAQAIHQWRLSLLQDMCSAFLAEAEYLASAPESGKADPTPPAAGYTLESFVAALNAKFTGKHSFGFTQGVKFARVDRSDRLDGTGRSAYCFIDTEGNIYKPASWKGPAKGVRSTLATVDISRVDQYGGWLYR